MIAKRMVLLAGVGEPTRICFNALRSFFPPVAVVLEQPVPRREFLAKRARRFGWRVVAGQLLFSATVVPWLRSISGTRRKQILHDFSLDPSPIPESEITYVDSVNSSQTIQTLQELRPDFVLLCGTRIVSPQVLEQVPAVFLNIHAGITPLYRGVHGAYWALSKGQPEACGVTVHLVDKGIDSGGILAQAIIRPTAEDSFVTYPLLQLGVGLQLLSGVLKRMVACERWTLPAPQGESVLWTHPTFMQYWQNRRKLGIK